MDPGAAYSAANRTYFNWRLRASPFVFNDFENNLTIHCSSALQTEIHRTTHSLKVSNGQFVEGEVDGYFYLTDNLRSGLFMRGSWLRMEGTGKMGLSIIGTTLVGRTKQITDALGNVLSDVPITPGNREIPNSTLVQASYALGLNFDYRF